MKKIKYTGVRPNILDVWWNAFMVKDCKEWDEYNIPFCRTLKEDIPEDVIIDNGKDYRCNI